MQFPLTVTLVTLVTIFLSISCTPNRTNVERGLDSQELFIGIGSEPEGLDPH